MFWLRKRVKLPIKMTIQVNWLGYEKQMQLLKRLYPILKQDKHWHFLFEPELIIRMSVPRLIVMVERYLQKYDYLFEVYDYPHPKKGFGEGKKYIHLSPLLIPIWHCHSEAIMTVKEKDMKYYFDRVTHTYLNMRGTSFLTEGMEHMIIGLKRVMMFQKEYSKMMFATKRSRA